MEQAEGPDGGQRQQEPAPQPATVRVPVSPRRADPRRPSEYAEVPREVADQWDERAWHHGPGSW